MSEREIAAVELLKSAKTIAVVGFSANPNKPAHTAPMRLVERGWNVIPVNPTTDQVAGMRSYKSLAEIDEPIDIVDVFRPAEFAPEIVQQAIAAKAKVVWLQLGLRNEQAHEIANESGMEYVEDLCAGALADKYDIKGNA